MTLADREMIEEFKHDLESILGENMLEFVLFGSYARDNHVPGSDVDVAILVQNESEVEEKEVWNLVEDYRKREDVGFSPKIIEAEKFEHRVDQGYSFYTEVDEEGVRI